MRCLRELVRRHKTRKEESQASSEPPPLPSLPRPPDVHPAARDVSPQDQSLFFRLPTELRMKILHTAFGDRTIHIDFRFRPPLHTYETSGGHEPVHGGYPPLAEYFPSPRKWEPKPRGAPAWRWWSCVCHSSMPHDYKDWRYYYQFPVWYDSCLEGGFRSCWYWPSTDPERCQVGIMGYLLSCKRG